MGFRLRLIIAITVLIAITFGIGGTLLISASFSAALDKETQAALDSFESVQNTLLVLNSLGGQTSLDSLSRALVQVVNARANLMYIILTEEDWTRAIPGAKLLPPGTLSPPETGRCAYTQVRDESGWSLVVVGALSAGEEQPVLAAQFDITPVYQARAEQQRLFLSVYAAVVLLGILTSSLLSFALTGRLKKLTQAVRRISGGDLGTRSGIGSRDEFGQLSRDIDAMADKLQENISRLESQVERQDAFMGAFAHEIKTPMTSIIGYADLLRQDGLEDQTRLLAADYIFSEGQRLEKLSFKLLDLLLLKKDAPEMKEVGLPSFLQEIEKLLSPALREKDIELTCRAAPGKAVLEPDLVKSLLYNLVDNAAKAIEGGGRITVTGTETPGGCCFHVTDTGRGMAPEELSRITEAFYRVDKARSRSQGGAGLGLALCQEIVTLHHGNMRFESAPGQGTRVTVTLYKTGGKEDA